MQGLYLRARQLLRFFFFLFCSTKHVFISLSFAGEKKEADKSTSKDSETDKPDKDSSNL